MFETRIAESFERPLELDIESSKVYNYIRRSIEEEEREQTERDEDGEEKVIKVTVYTYEETLVPKSMWAMYQNYENMAEAVDYILMGGM